MQKKKNIRFNSFFENVSKIPLNSIYEVIKCFTCFIFNKKQAHTYLKNEKNIIISENIIKEIYQKI